MKTRNTVSALYSNPGFRARSTLTGIYGDPYARVIKLVRCQKKQSAQFVIHRRRCIMIAKANGQETFRAVCLEYTLNLNTAVYFARNVMP